MVITIHNMLDFNLLKSELEKLPMDVRNTLKNRLDVLQESTGTATLATEYGASYIYIITESTPDREDKINEILKFFNIIDKDMYEYSESISNNDSNREVCYRETLYLLATGEQSVLIFSTEGQGER